MLTKHQSFEPLTLVLVPRSFLPSSWSRLCSIDIQDLARLNERDQMLEHLEVKVVCRCLFFVDWSMFHDWLICIHHTQTAGEAERVAPKSKPARTHRIYVAIAGVIVVRASVSVC